MTRVPLSTLLVMGIAALFMVDSCSAKADVAVAEAAVAHADSALRVARDSIETFRAASLEAERADSASMAAHADSVAARAVADTLSAIRAREAAERAEAASVAAGDVAAELVARLDSAEVLLFERYVEHRDARDAELVAQRDEAIGQRDRARDTAAQRLTAMGIKDSRIAALEAELGAEREGRDLADAALRARDGLVTAQARENSDLRRENVVLKLLAGAAAATNVVLLVKGGIG